MNLANLLQAFIVIAALSPSVAGFPNMTVLVLDALDGKPQADVVVHYSCDEIPHSLTTQATTNASGVADVLYSCKLGHKMEFWVAPKNNKEGCGEGVAATAEEILSTGVIGRPDSGGGIRCPTKISGKITPVSGQVTMVVKKPTWWQAHVAG